MRKLTISYSVLPFTATDTGVYSIEERIIACVWVSERPHTNIIDVQ